MKEKIYSIPVNDGFAAECECPLCSMYKRLEDDAIEYTMGPSYMEDDTRALTDASGFCRVHMKMLYEYGNRLGAALILKTHFDKVIKDIGSLSLNTESKKSLFAKKADEESQAAAYLDTLNHSCFVCSRINNVFDRYIDTVFYLWQKDEEFQNKLKGCRGFCNEHFARLLKAAPKHLSGGKLQEFNQCIQQRYLSNMERVRDDLEWFINKFDYRYANEPWKNSKDAIPRAMTKTNGIIIEEK